MCPQASTLHMLASRRRLVKCGGRSLIRMPSLSSTKACAPHTLQFRTSERHFVVVCHDVEEAVVQGQFRPNNLLEGSVVSTVHPHPHVDTYMPTENDTCKCVKTTTTPPPSCMHACMHSCAHRAWQESELFVQPCTNQIERSG